ncbi:MAG: DUF2281 domain-containing protein [Gemmatimonadetes bacterium]|nr:DUF2281 domain-containing protein [Gemmatimonadota bacterium]
MHDLLRERLLRKLDVLPEAQLYQVLDYIEFLEAKYAAGLAAKPDALQRFAERLEDGMRVRNVAPKVISGTVGLVGTARRVIRTVTDTGRELIDEVAGTGTAKPSRAIEPGATRPIRPDEKTG